MERAYHNLRECVKHAPVGLLSLPEKLRKQADSYLPFSTGIEFEVYPLSIQNKEDAYMRLNNEESLLSKLTEKFMDLDLMVIDISIYESRFRLHPGVRGMISLYNLCERMKSNFGLNPKSGLHYHIDNTGYGHKFDELYYIEYASKFGRKKKDVFDFVLDELDSWGYTGEFNRRSISTTKNSWVNISRKHTLEFRIGEMTFDYDLIIKRIMHCQSLTARMQRRVKEIRAKTESQYFPKYSE